MTTSELSQNGTRPSWVRQRILLDQSLGEYLRSLLTPFNVVVGLILWIGIPLTIIRFSQGLADTTNLDDTNPWGLWIGFDVLTGVALAAGGYVIASIVYIFGLKEYQPVARAAVLTGFLGYFFVVVGLLFDLGRPWRLPYPMVFSMGVTSVMFLVAWHVALYLTCQFVEFSPAVFEWTGWKRLRKWAIRIALGATILGVMLSTLHQSALGALFLLTPGKLHPLWYSPLIPIFFFVSSVIGGISMVIIESTLSHRIFLKHGEPADKEKLDNITFGLGHAAALVLFPYFWFKVIGIIHNDSYQLLDSAWGAWFLVELLGFVALPCFLFLYGVKQRSVSLVRWTAVLTVLGIVLNRLNVSIIAFNWDQPDRYVPKWSEYMITITIVTLAILTFRWIVNRMPVLKPHPDYGDDH